MDTIFNDDVEPPLANTVTLLSLTPITKLGSSLKLIAWPIQGDPPMRAAIRAIIRVDPVSTPQAAPSTISQGTPFITLTVSIILR